MAQKNIKRVHPKGTSNELLSFIKDTKQGKFTSNKPQVVQVTYQRLEIQEQDKSYYTDGQTSEVILLGVSY